MKKQQIISDETKFNVHPPMGYKFDTPDGWREMTITEMLMDYLYQIDVKNIPLKKLQGLLKNMSESSPKEIIKNFEANGYEIEIIQDETK